MGKILVRYRQDLVRGVGHHQNNLHYPTGYTRLWYVTLWPKLGPKYINLILKIIRETPKTLHKILLVLRDFHLKF